MWSISVSHLHRNRMISLRGQLDEVINQSSLMISISRIKGVKDVASKVPFSNSKLNLLFIRRNKTIWLRSQGKWSIARRISICSLAEMSRTASEEINSYCRVNWWMRVNNIWAARSLHLICRDPFLSMSQQQCLANWALYTISFPMKSRRLVKQ